MRPSRIKTYHSRTMGTQGQTANPEQETSKDGDHSHFLPETRQASRRWREMFEVLKVPEVLK
jgi:hypothetical protein